MMIELIIARSIQSVMLNKGEEMHKEELETCKGLIATEFLLNASDQGLIGDDTFQSMATVIDLLKMGMVEVVYDDRVAGITIKAKDGDYVDFF